MIEQSQRRIAVHKQNNHESHVMNERTQKPKAALAGSAKLSGLVCCVCICATVAFIANLVISPRSAPSPRLWLPVVVATNGIQATLMNETRQMEFWTPSAKTGDYLPKEGGEVAKNDKWQVISNDDPVLQFGMLLHTNANVLGYRRVEVWGQGRTGFKPGWWWTMNVFTNYSADDLAETYRNFWKSPQPLFVEVIDNRGSDE
jgi:hypothetical protein